MLASSIFATTFQRAAVGTAALASNLVGSVVGGLLEYTSMVVGLRALSLLALAMYGLALLSWKLSERQPAMKVRELVGASH